MELSKLPEECLSRILSLTSPSDVLRSSAVSKLFLPASVSDTVWVKFLPSDYQDILSQASSTLPQFASKKDLFLFLCSSPILLNANTQSFLLDKWSGKKCYMLGARTLTIEWGETAEYWSWKPVLESRFPEAAVLNDVCWLDITGRFPTKLLSKNTTYGAYFVFMIDVETFRGFDAAVSVYVCEHEEEGSGSSSRKKHVAVKRFFIKSPNARKHGRRPKELPVKRADGWLEIEMGRYKVGAHDEGVVLEMALKEIEDLHWKSGIVVQGIEIRPFD